MTINRTNKIFKNQYEIENERNQVEINSKIPKFRNLENLPKYIETNLTIFFFLNRSIKSVATEKNKNLLK